MWPTPQDYNEAIQQPGLCFADSDLKGSMVELNHLGLPRSMTGSFASVYRMSNLDRTFAVRCFLEGREDLEERYAAIARTLADSGLSCFVGFEFVEKGIKVLGRWYPIVKMEWVDGEPLEKYLDRFARNSSRVESVSRWFDEMIAGLAAHDIAHGDLQHGNILVGDSGIKLIDYDGMFVPSLSGKSSPELGHRNFQHPGRGQDFYDSGLDNFSTWVIAVSLKALSLEPGLWRELGGGDDCLLFRSADFKSPENSLVFRTLLAHESEELKAMTEKFLRLLVVRPQSIPPLSVEGEALKELLADESLVYIERTVTASEHGRVMGSVDHTQWLIDQIAALEAEKSLPARRSARGVSRYARLVDNVGRSMSTMGKQAWRRMVSVVARMQWVQEGLDEAGRAFNDNDYLGAIKVYSELAEWSAVAVESSDRDAIIEKAIEVFINLGYCYVEINQLGTAAHYFKEAKRIAHENGRGEEELRAALLISAAYFELGQRDRAIIDMEKAVSSPSVLIGAVRREKGWSFGRRITIPSMMVDLGHKYVRDNAASGAKFCYEAAMESLRWLEHAGQSQAEALISRATAGVCITRIDELSKAELVEFFLQHVDTPVKLQDLLQSERKGMLSSDPRYGDLLRLLADHFSAAEEGESAEAAYRTALAVYRAAGQNRHQSCITLCLLGLGKVEDAVTGLLASYPWEKGYSRELSEKLVRVGDYLQALCIGTLIFEDDSQRSRYPCIERLIELCPEPGVLLGILSDLESSRIGSVLALAELFLAMAAELKELSRMHEAKLHYASAFRTFQRVGLEEEHGSAIMESLLGSGDLETAAGLLIDGGNLETTIKLLAKVMIGRGAYQAETTTRLMQKVIEHQLSLPVAAVGEYELNKSLELLEWCAGEDSPVLEQMREGVNRWFEHRELNIAHNLVSQGQFGPAQSIFEKYEGPAGPNVVSVLELWAMKYLITAVADGSSQALTDRYTLGCATEIISTLREREALRPEFAAQVAELISKASPLGVSGKVRQMGEIFSALGPDFAEASQRIEEFCNRGDSTAEVSEDAGDSSTGLPLQQDAIKPEVTASELAERQIWQGLHRAMVLIDGESYKEAIKAFSALEKMDRSGHFMPDIFIGIGYCHFLLEDREEAESFLKRAVHSSRHLEQGKFFRASLALAYYLKTPAGHKPELRTLIDPSLEHKEVLKIAARLRGRPIDFHENLAINLAGLLYEQAVKIEQTSDLEAACPRYKAALTIYGVEAEICRSEVIDCLDAAGQSARAASRLKDAVDRSLMDTGAVDDLLMKVARRHVRDASVARVSTFYESVGIALKHYVDVAERELVVQTISRILISEVTPRTLFAEVTRELFDMRDDGRLDARFCLTIARFIESNIVFCSETRRQQCRAPLLRIGRVLESVHPRSYQIIEEAMDKPQLPINQAFNP